MTYLLKTSAATKTLAGRLVRKLKPENRQATIVALSGDLGAGKTTFVQGAAAALGITEPIISPTFVLEKVYRLARQPFKRLVHLDGYRLTQPRELEALGWVELVADPANLIFIEWPENFGDELPPGHRHLWFRVINETTRKIVVGAPAKTKHRGQN